MSTQFEAGSAFFCLGVDKQLSISEMAEVQKVLNSPAYISFFPPFPQTCNKLKLVRFQTAEHKA